MSTSDRQLPESEDSRRKVVIIVALIAALAIGGLFYFLMRASSRITVEPTLEGAIRPGSPEFAEYASKIFVEAPEAHQGKPVREKTAVILPTTGQRELDPNHAMVARIRLEGMTDSDDRANIKMEVTGFKFK